MNTYEYALMFIPPLYPWGNDYLKFCIFHALAFKIKMVFIHVQVIYYLFLSFIFKKHHIVYNLLKMNLLKKISILFPWMHIAWPILHYLTANHFHFCIVFYCVLILYKNLFWWWMCRFLVFCYYRAAMNFCVLVI